MKKLYIFLSLLLPAISFGQSCFKPFSASCWFGGTGTVRISDDGSRFMALDGDGPTGNTNATGTSCGKTNTEVKIYEVSSSGITYNYAQSGDPTFASDFTANEGFFTTVYTTGDKATLYFEDSTGVSHSILADLSYPSYFERAAGHPNMYSVRMAGPSDGDKLVIAEASNPLAPTATTVTLPGGRIGGKAVVDYGRKRIYYAASEFDAASLFAPYYKQKIKCCDLSGNAVPGWTDVVIHRGEPITMKIRATDGRLFVRMVHTDRHYSFHGLVVINPDGTLPQDMNFTDLSIMSSPSGFGTGSWSFDLGFDGDGNIYANIWPAHQSVNPIPTSMMKFDPQGNLDMSFLRNQWNSYGMAIGGGAGSFDITDGGVIIKSTNHAHGAAEDHYALDINHVNKNNEDPIGSYSFSQYAINTWGTYSLFRNAAPVSAYQELQFLFNNGKLIRPDMIGGDITANCGIAPPQIVPPVNDPGTGVINCPKTAFISAPVSGNSSNIVIRVEINVTKLGTFSPISVQGSGFSLVDPAFRIQATELGVHTFDIPVHYDGTTLGTLDITVGQAGSCMADLSDMNNKKRVEVEIWTPENCTFKQVGPALR